MFVHYSSYFILVVVGFEPKIVLVIFVGSIFVMRVGSMVLIVIFGPNDVV